MKILAFAITGALIVANAPAEAFPIALPGSEGLSVIVASDSEVVATYQGNSASFSNYLDLLQDAFGNPGDDGDLGNDRFLFNNQTSPVGSQVTVGSFTAGTELIFRLYVNNTQLAYFTGPASRNPDGLPHARVEDEWQPGESLVSFEDLFGTPEGANGFNDLSFSFTNTRSSSVPEPTSVMMLGVALMFGSRRLLRR